MSPGVVSAIAVKPRISAYHTMCYGCNRAALHRPRMNPLAGVTAQIGCQ